MLEVLDTAGQEDYTALRDQWIRDGEGFVLVYCINSRTSFARIKKFFKSIHRVKESSHSGSPSYPGSPLSMSSAAPGTYHPAPVMLVGNKCDRITEREVSTQEGSALARELGCDFVEASAKTCVNVEKAFYDVVRQLRRQRNDTVGLSDNKRQTETKSHFAHPHRERERTSDRLKGSSKGPKTSNRCVII